MSAEIAVLGLALAGAYLYKEHWKRTPANTREQSRQEPHTNAAVAHAPFTGHREQPRFVAHDTHQPLSRPGEGRRDVQPPGGNPSQAYTVMSSTELARPEHYSRSNGELVATKYRPMNTPYVTQEGAKNEFLEKAADEIQGVRVDLLS